MFGQVWSNNTIRKYVIYFGTLFNNVWLQRDNDAREVVQTMKVPLNYGPKEKFLARLEGNPNLDRPIAITLPRMSFEIINFAYDPSRKLTTIGRSKTVNPDNSDQMFYQYNPVPYDIEFSLYIMVKNQEDGTRIVEQILPYFTPDFTATLNVNPQMGVKYDVPLTLNSIQQQDTYEGDFIERRSIIWTLNFTMKAWMFGPVRSGDVIKSAEPNIIVPPSNVTIQDAADGTTNVDPIIEITVRPGLTANGQPTSNPTLSVTSDLISADDNYGFIIEFMENLS
jgi:hypothetical protein